MNLTLLAKLDKKNTKNIQKINDDVMPEIYDFTAIFSIYDQLGTFQKLNSRSTAWIPDSANFMSNLLSDKNWKQG